MAIDKNSQRSFRKIIFIFSILGCDVACSEKSTDTPPQPPDAEISSPVPVKVGGRVSNSAPHIFLNDTGITWGGNYPKDINHDCTAVVDPSLMPAADILQQQDCANGRDSDKGHASFEYVKFNAAGEALPVSARTWQCVLDVVTGLYWEVKSSPDGNYGNGGLHDGDDIYTWYNSNITENGGAVGDWNARLNQCAEYTEKQPMTYCNIEEFVRRVNEAGLCGFDDWRVPSRPQLETLVHFGRTRPAIAVDFFPHTKNEFYWSRTATAGFKEMAWGVSFQFGYAAPLQRNNSRPVRLVRNGNE